MTLLKKINNYIKNTNGSLFYLYLIFIIILFIIIYTFFKIPIRRYLYENFENSIEVSYFRCNKKKLSPLMKKVFESYNFKNNNKNWNLYLPCGYNDIEKELKEIDLSSSNNNNQKYIFGINGCDHIVSKDGIWSLLKKSYDIDEACNIIPQTWLLNNKDELRNFEKYYASHDPDDIYILKKNIQRKEGIKLTRDLYEIKDANNEDYKIVQIYLRNLFLIENRKVNLRMYYFVVIDQNRKYFYLYDEGKCIYTNKNYNDSNLDFESNITSYKLDLDVYDSLPRSLNDLKKYIKEKNLNPDILFNQIQTLFLKLSSCISNSIYQSKNLKNTISFQLFGADVLFDENLKPYLLELNKGPDMLPKDEKDSELKEKVIEDMFKTVHLIPDLNKNNKFQVIYKS